ncbi:5-formyltetrahydrofolate cyclo-ligase [Marinilongibacter aquaticus]|uniref:5-formyltetrahydrofolate cyclo-ligase n=1 Tax=Marinilongibacter aquaticus TaxID=2975157 RepID=UPI0021BD39E0|nr:5-formyltetrahydrofolate cyclo-ligase [Marinilongibacter aquaticus]UBM57439.1 5-formyltetrahydrofolate cyclo-ligase [Marinilongibacter aquaticus]
MHKTALREKYLKLREELSPEEIGRRNRLIVDLFFSRLMIHRYDKVHVYLPVLARNEVDTRAIIHTLLADFPAEVFVPKMQKAHQLSHHHFDKYTVTETNKWGIPEPTNKGMSSADFFKTEEDILVIVPLLSFDKTLHRVGYGGGFYDRFLAHKTSNTLTVGLSYFPAAEKIEGLDDTDLPLNHVISPERVW